MPETSDGAESSYTTVNNQLANLVPSFDPSKDDLQVYQQKVALLLEAWPSGKYTELATRLILNCAGSAFKKLQLHQAELMVNDRKSIQRIVELLGGHWGQIHLEQKYEFAERALYKCMQKSDESADSYLARADIMWTELNSKKFQLSDLQAYVTLRGSILSAEDKKRVLIDADVTDKGELTVARVGASIRMLGAGFFQEMTSGKRVSKLKTYDQTALMADDIDETEHDQYAMTADSIEEDDQTVENLAQEGDDDASLVMDFEAAAADLLQNDEELASAFTAYTDARRRLNEKVRSRGFWPISQKGKSKGGWKGVKGKFTKGHPSSRKSLQQRILESRCRLCNQVGHWKAECPTRRDSAGASSRPSQAPTTFAQVIQPTDMSSSDALPMEFLHLPEHSEMTLDVSQHNPEVILMVQHVDKSGEVPNPTKLRLQQTLRTWKAHQNDDTAAARIDADDSEVRLRLRRRLMTSPESLKCEHPEPEPTCFASHGSFGIVDLGATKTVIGSKLVPELLNSLDPSIRSQVTRCPCSVTFRFGNHGILQSQQALVVPISGLLLKVAVVPGSTPFLLSNTLLRALGATIDTAHHTLHATKLRKSFQLNLTSKGLFLLDLNDLAQPVQTAENFSKPTETHATVCDSEEQPAIVSKTPAVTTAWSTSFPNMSYEHTANQTHQVTNTQDETFHTHDEHVNARKEKSENHEHQLSDQSSLRSKLVPQSHQVIRRKRNGDVDPIQEAPEGATATAGSRIRLQPHVDGPAGGHEDPIRPYPCGENVQSHVVPGAEMGPVVHPALSPEHQVGTPSVHVLRGEEGREERIDWSESANPKCHRPSHREGAWATGTASRSTAKGQSHGNGIRDDRGPGQSVGLGRRPRVVRCPARRRTDATDRVDGPRPDSEPTGESDGDCGECPEPDHQLYRAEHHDADQRAVSPGEDPSISKALLAGDLSDDCNYPSNSNFTPESNRERVHFQNLIQQYSKELQTIVQHHQHNREPRLDLLEVFCGPQSQLTSQAQKLGYRAERFGMLQGDLQTLQGRDSLFHLLVERKPKQVWFSPTCGPWSGFSCLNGSRSLESWDALQQDRMKHLGQLALGIVILRFQRQHSNHMHWEQPRGSLMLKVPYMQEVRYYMLPVDVDLCVAGNLKDPNNGLPIKKSLTIMTTSEYMVKSLHGLRCPGNHQHQTIEGQVVVEGQKINRSTFTENYPRKFARKLAFILGRVQKPSEVPYRNEVWSILAAEEEHPESPSPKRPKLQRYASAKLSRTREVTQLPWGKRQKCSVKTKPLDAKASWKAIFDQVHEILPRVGRRGVDQTEIVQSIQALIPEKEIMSIVACRGASRTLAPPEHILKGMAPLRRCIYTERGSGEIRAEEDWEPWENLAKRNLIRPSHVTRINITLFAREKPTTEQSTTSASSPCMIGSRAADSQQTLSVNPSDQVTSEETEENLQKSNSDSAKQPASQDLSSSQIADLQSPHQSARFRSLPRDEQVALLRAHKNLGHPSGERLSTLLRSQGFRAEVAQAALDLKCSTCQENQQPKLARPGSIRDELDFNDRICMDEFDWTNKDGTQFRVFHIVDWATNFQCARIVPDRSSAAIIQLMIDMWFAWAGSPSEVIVDAGSEFNSEEFAVFAQANNIKITTISPEAQYQNGKAERHGSVLKTMLTKFESDHNINQYMDLAQALYWCVRAKNASSLKKGFPPEMLVLGKQTRMPGAVCSDEMLPAHFLADAETAQGIAFRRQLAMRETARLAFFQADNDASLRRAMLRRSRPGNRQYEPGEWVMTWRQGKGAHPGHWLGPMKVVVHENAQTVWTTLACKLYRCAPEHVRPVTAHEAREIPVRSDEPSISTIAQQLSQLQSQGITRAIDIPDTIPIENPINPNPNPTTRISTESEGQPDDEPEVPSQKSPNSSQPDDSHEAHNPETPNVPSTTEENNPLNDPAITTPIPESSDDDLMCDNLLCIDDDPCLISADDDLAWRCEIPVLEKDIEAWKQEPDVAEMAFLVSAAKRQRSEVKLTNLTAAEKLEFQKAKRNEVENWIKTGTISKILRNQVPHDQILRCRWV